MLVPDFVYQSELAPALEPIPAGGVPAAAPPPHTSPTLATGDGTQTLDGVTGVVVRVKEVYIRDNRRSRRLFGDGPADVYPIFLVANGHSDVPVAFALPGMFNGIRDKDYLPIAQPGVAIQRNLDGLPPFLDIHVLLMRSLKKQRDFAGALDRALESREGRSILDTLGTVASGSGVAGVALNLSASLLDLVVTYLSRREDKQIFYGAVSLERSADQLGIGRTHRLEHRRYARALVEVVGVKPD